MDKGQNNIISVVLVTAVTIGIIASTYYWGVPLIEKSKSSTEVTSFEETLSRLESAIEEVANNNNQKVLELNIKGKLTVDSDNDVIYYTYNSQKPLIASKQWVSLNDEYPYTRKVYGIKSQSDFPKRVNVPECGNDCYLEGTCDNNGNLVMQSCDIVEGTSSFSENDQFTCNYNGEIKDFVVNSVNCTQGGYLLISTINNIKYGIIGRNKAGVIMARSKGYKDNYINEYSLVFREMDDLSTKKGNIIDLVIKGNPVAYSGNHKIIISKGEVTGLNQPSAVGGDLTKTKIYIQIN